MPFPHPRSRRTVFAMSLFVGLAPTAFAEDGSPPDTHAMLEEITVSATRTERRLDNVPATVTVITQQDAEARGARDIKDLFADELDVTVPLGPNRYSIGGNSTARAGNESINIRGLEGNQVLMMVDGIRVPASFAFGAFATGRGDYLDISGFRKAEVLRGPASTQYGSDGLSGAVFFHTIEPRDLLQDGQTAGGFVNSGYSSIDRSWTNAAGVAAQGDGWGSLLQVSYSAGHELGNQGGNTAQDATRTAPNPADTGMSNVLGKLQRQLDAFNQLGLTVESFRHRQQTEVYSARAVPPYSATSTVDLQTDDRVERDRVSLKHQFNAPGNAWMQQLDTQIYWQRAKVAQLTAEDRYSAADRTRDNAYISNTFGLSSIGQSTLTGAAKQRLSYGLDWSQSQVESPLNGTVPPMGTTYPSKAFPDTAYTQGGAFLQDEIELGAVSLVPGLRFDQYRLAPSAAGYSGSIVTLSDQAWSPRFGAVWRLLPQLAPYAQWSRGFRAPTPDQVNSNFSNPVFGYTSIGNPNLKAERANSVEVGLRGKLDRLRYSLAYYDNRYDSLISQQIVSGAGTPSNPSVFQYVNLNDARIRGWEARAEWFIDERWRLKAGVAAARGDSNANGVSQPLNTIEPLKALLTLAYDAERWGGNATVQHANGKSSSDIAPPANGSQFAPPAWTTMDLGAFWKPVKALTINAGINNVFNRKYWRWSDVRGLASNGLYADAWTAPGRSAYLAARYHF
ncbi:MAG: TonB-dependent hemoglobin/transferrin/lactoferrin family receptor [Paludibacterium sp.]|uniref:TonB-dependent hemoglobin/transferrin/lactoferrin family receptor n=1 Tax=Paludibacterium sp. TaxID=1917523 RepID=UPI0025E793CF|nr:TonB-dependent hemoglobin/transferrin/lactoferrin family receptor [Paludibacterium sp.]MBV8045937.1 TonB-dependent hemoglobin/transferrin/lactoferrin family receptor [Paludibacterium sp.]MBV8647883.1 TonB-dependent hemoglobin/transferrin/lactoferrin family receptor [Paludibacterium sp.]